MSVKLNELPDESISLTDLIAKSDTNGLMTKTNIEKLANYIGAISTSGMKAAIESTSAAPAEDGLYPCTESGTYTNFGGEIVDITSQLVFISVSESQTVFTLVEIPVNTALDSVPTDGSTNAVESDGVYSFGKQIAENQNLIPNADFRGITQSNSDSEVSRYIYGVNAGKDTNGLSIVEGVNIPFGSFNKSLKVISLTGQNINVYTGKTDTNIILQNSDKYSVGAWIYNSDWAAFDGNLYCIDINSGVYFETSYKDFNNLRFYYLENQSFTSANGGVQIRFNIDSISATVDSTFYISTPSIIQGNFIFPHIYSNFYKTVELDVDYVTKDFLTNDQRFQFKDWLVDKDFNYSSDELTIIDAVYDIQSLKVPISENGDTFAIVILTGSDTTNKFRIQIRNITLGTTVFDTYTSLEHHGYNTKGLSLVRTSAAGVGTHDFLILIDWSKIPNNFSFINSLSEVKFNLNENWSNPYSTMTNIFPLFNDLTGRKWNLWGDSISANAGYWHEQANQYLQMELSINAVGGDEIADQVSDLDTLLAGDATFFNDKSLVSFMAIFNTWNQGYLLGNANDSTVTASYCGKLKYFIETVLNSNELVKLVLMTQYITSSSTNTNGDTQADFNEKTGEIALLYGLPLIDWGKDSGCNPINAGTSSSSGYDRLKFTGDGVHPGRYGGEILSKYFSKQVLTRIQTFF